VQEFAGANNGVHRAGGQALGAPNAHCLVYYGHAWRRLDTHFWIDWAKGRAKQLG
jgi:hypothetical protein